jgi:hypothetical protein
VTVMEEEWTSEYSEAIEEEEENSTEFLIILSQEDEQEMTATLKPRTEEATCNMDFVDLYKELEALERRVIVKSHHIQQVKLEESGEEF